MPVYTLEGVFTLKPDKCFADQLTIYSLQGTAAGPESFPVVMQCLVRIRYVRVETRVN